MVPQTDQPADQPADLPPGPAGATERRRRPRENPSGFASVVSRNISALMERRRQDDARRSAQDRAADTITRFTGSMAFVYIHLALFGAWIAVNLGWIPGIPRFDRSFTVLAMAASVEAIFLSTFVLISQNRMQALADKRADLDLQVSLLSEHEVTHLIQLVREIARRMNIAEARDPALDELAQDIKPETVLSQMEATEERGD